MEDRLLNGTGQVAVEEPVLHPDQLRFPLGHRLFPLPLEFPHVRERRLDARAEPLGDIGRHLEPVELIHEHVQQVVLLHPHRRVLIRLVVVRAPIVDVLTSAPVQESALDALAGHRESAVGAADDPTREYMDVVGRAPVLAVEEVLACVERLPVDQEPVLPLMDAPVAVEFPRIEPVVQDVGQRRAVETRRAGPVDETLVGQLLRQALERVLAGRVEVEGPHNGLGLLGVRLDRLGLVGHVQVSERREAGRPSLPHLLVHPLQDFGAKVVGVVLRDGRHDVERQGSRRARPELVVHEGELHPTGILELL